MKLRLWAAALPALRTADCSEEEDPEEEEEEDLLCGAAIWSHPQLIFTLSPDIPSTGWACDPILTPRSVSVGLLSQSLHTTSSSGLFTQAAQ